ncbi:MULTISPECIES: hypothetical protein [Sphingobacterium]|uniref:Uncharacterized protein n=1 Tax=Sphingobacterium ginsenosidimutans TaxID=687845 RepID=A0ABP8A7X6_9SPHI|nr:hypothetical protein [Sphingobacterium sp. E70]ULT25416.1 hypothetical protein KUH03_42710 [Sphingobacterium sp. E70]
MGNTVAKMLEMYGLSTDESLIDSLDATWSESEIKEYCWRVLRTFPDLKKENWSTGIEGGDYIYSFSGHYVFITDDIWSFNLIAERSVLKLLVEQMVELNKTKHYDI